MGEEKEKGTSRGTSKSPQKDINVLDRSTSWAKKNIQLLRGGALFVVGFFLVIKTYMVFLHVALAFIGTVCIMYGLYELKFTPLPKIMINLYNKFFNKK